jgi:uncharacterized membrane protein YtjA (UPF0391 family)
VPALRAACLGICSLTAARFLRTSRPSRAGTIVSGPDYFSSNECEENIMLSWVVTFLIIALVAGLLGFGGIAGASIEIAKIVFFIAIALFVISALVGLMRGRGNV